VKPGGQGRAYRSGLAREFHEALLRGILGILGIAQDPQAGTEYESGMAAHEFRKGLRVFVLAVSLQESQVRFHWQSPVGGMIPILTRSMFCSIDTARAFFVQGEKKIGIPAFGFEMGMTGWTACATWS
jgi:hypothetical protein